MIDNAWLRRYSRVVAAATLFLIFAGGMVTSTGSGLAVPDWPLSYGQLFPPMVGGIFYEHGHRLVAGTVAMLMAVLCVWIWRREKRAWVRRLGFAAMGAVLAQALLGGLTVLLLLPPAVSISHAALAELFLALTFALAVVLSRGWIDAPPRRPAPPAAVPLPTLASIVTALLYGQILLGALVRHTGAGLAIPDFPLMFGRLLPPSLVGGVGIHFAHRFGALLVCIAVSWLSARVFGRHGADGWLARPMGLLLGLVLLQITLGALTIWTVKAPVPTSLHVVTGAACLAASLVVTLRCWRRYSRPVVEAATVAGRGALA